MNTRPTFLPRAARAELIRAMLTEEGVVIHDIAVAFGYASTNKPTAILKRLCDAGLAFVYGSSNVPRRYFSTSAGRDAYAEQFRAEVDDEHRKRAAEASRRYREAKAAPRKQRANEVDAARRQREKAEKISLKARLRAETKAAGALVFKKGTTGAGPKPKAWADIPTHNPNGVEPVELPNTLRDRFAVDEAPPCFSSLRPGQYIAPAPAWLQVVARP